MKQRRRGAFLAALWWLVGCLCLGVLLLLLAPRQERFSEQENRMLAGFPSFSRETLASGAFFTGVEDYLSDGFFARADVIEAAEASLELFNHQTEEQRQIQQEAETNALLAADADGSLWEQEMAEEAGEEAAPQEAGPGRIALSGAASVTPAAAVATPVASPSGAPSVAASATPTAAPSTAPSVAASATPTAAPSAAPSVAASATPAAAVATPAASPSAVPSVAPSATPAPAAATATPDAAPSPSPTPTPRVIVPLAQDASYRLELLESETEASRIYEYSAANVMTFAQTLNYLKALLPDGGEVHYLQPPVADVGRRLSVRTSPYIGWRSDMEDALATQVTEGVHIYNVPEILNGPLTAKQDIYYYTDHHWTPLAAWYAVEAIMRERGYPVIPYDAYEYQSRIMRRDHVGREDWLHFLYPLAPTHSYVLTYLTDEKELPFMNYRSTTYTGYINNTRTPWRRFTSGYGSQRRALLISDSFGNVFLPYLLPYYGEVHMTDLRASYFKEIYAGGTFAELLKYHQIDDIYVVLSTSNGINSKNSQEVMWNTITAGGGQS